MAGRLARTAWCAAALAGASCGSPPPPAPSAVINASPSSVCVGDAFRTEITLDLDGTAPALTLVPAPPDPDAGPLTCGDKSGFACKWSFSGNAVSCADAIGRADLVGSYCIDGDPTIDHTVLDTLTLRVSGDRPLEVRLHVTNSAGGQQDAVRVLSVTALTDDGQCPLPASP